MSVRKLTIFGEDETLALLNLIESAPGTVIAITPHRFYGYGIWATDGSHTVWYRANSDSEHRIQDGIVRQKIPVRWKS